MSLIILPNVLYPFDKKIDKKEIISLNIILNKLKRLESKYRDEEKEEEILKDITSHMIKHKIDNIVDYKTPLVIRYSNYETEYKNYLIIKALGDLYKDKLPENIIYGKYLAFEGADLVGKTTIINKLKDIYKNNNRVIFISEPGTIKNSMCQKVEGLLKDKSNNLTSYQDLLLFSLSRNIISENIVVPNYYAGNITISDRCFLSSFIYQSDIETFKLINITMSSLAKYPDSIYVLYLPESVLEHRYNKKYENTKAKLDKFEEDISYIKEKNSKYIKVNELDSVNLLYSKLSGKGKYNKIFLYNSLKFDVSKFASYVDKALNTK